MGHDITPIARHNLDTQNVDALAHDLFSRLDVNIRYGYYTLENYSRLLGTDHRDGNFICLGELVKDKAFKTFRLIHDEYQKIELYKKFGRAILYDPLYWNYSTVEIPGETGILREEASLKFNCYDFIIETPDENDEVGSDYLYIYDHLFCNHIPYFARWWDLCRRFIDEADHYEPEYFQEYRQSIRHYAEKLGGDKAYYLDDQSAVMEGVGQTAEAEMTWDEFESFVIRKSGDLLLDIPRYFKDPDYKKQMVSGKTYPLAFVDDFSDMG